MDINGQKETHIDGKRIGHQLEHVYKSVQQDYCSCFIVFRYQRTVSWLLPAWRSVSPLQNWSSVNAPNLVTKLIHDSTINQHPTVKKTLWPFEQQKSGLSTLPWILHTKRFIDKVPPFQTDRRLIAVAPPDRGSSGARSGLRPLRTVKRWRSTRRTSHGCGKICCKKRETS